MIALPDSQRERLAKLCGLLASEHEGERANAAAQASKIIADTGITWRGIVEAAFTSTAPTIIKMPQASSRRRQRGRPLFRSSAESIEWALAQGARLSDEERGFLNDIRGVDPLCLRQQATLNRLLTNLLRRAA